MGDVKELLNLNWAEIIIGIIVIIVAVRFIWEAVSWLINKLGVKFSWKERNNQDHATLVQHSNSMETLLASNTQVVTKLDIVKNKVDLLESESENAKLADQQLLADRLLQASRYYINTLHGIPEDEVESFTNMYNLYVKRGDGNEGLNAKVQYCLDKLDVIPTSENYVVKKDNPLAGKIIM